MPFKSEKQRKYMYAKHPEIAKRWQKEGKGNVKPAKKAVAAKRAATKKTSGTPMPAWVSKAPKGAQGAYRKAVARKRGK